MWVRKRTVIGGRVGPDDWGVYWDRRYVGRVYKTILTNPMRNVWCWSKTYGYGRQGYALTLDDALEDLRNVILSMKADGSDEA